MAGNRGAFIGSGAYLDRNALDGVSAGGGCKLGKRLGDDFLIGAEACIDRIDRNKRGQDRRGGTCGNQIACRYFQPPDAARNRRAHFRILKIKLGGTKGRLGRTQACLRLVISAGPLVEAALGDGAGGDELASAFQFRLGQRNAGLFG